jgi:NAD(P)-dependent dehydrogenase (short-subunit alcohol dehydrogenase family)
MSRRTIIVTGANAGIGRATAHALAKQGARVALVCRDPARGQAAVDDIAEATGNRDVSLFVADLAEMAEVRRLAGELAEHLDDVHVLVNNVGAVFPQREMTSEGFEKTFALNHLGPFLLTNLLLDRLRASAPARIVNVSSQVHARSLDLTNLQGERGYVGLAAYRLTKLCNILFTYELARRLEGARVTANCLHPGVVATGLLKDYEVAQAIEEGRPAAPAARQGGGLRDLLGSVARRVAGGAGLSGISIEAGAKTSVFLASDRAVERVSGRYFVNCAEAPSAPVSHDAELATRLWELSARLVGLAAAQ